MAELPFPWCIYAEHQSKAAASGRVDDRSWGNENGLNTQILEILGACLSNHAIQANGA